MIIPVIMAGGSGTRLWPMSRSLYPKQFLPLVNETTMLEDTCLRLRGLNTSIPLVICGEDHRFTVAEQLREDEEVASIILEPAGRNTAPAVALAALRARELQPDQEPLLLVLAADHVITDVEAFQQTVLRAAEFAENGQLVTFGIVPTGPETGYGYIKSGLPLSNGAHTVAEFVEKPDLATAKRYIKSEQYLWNSGMFIFKASRYLEELKLHHTNIYDACVAAMDNAQVDVDFIRPDAKTFLNCPDESIDYAVMEKTSDAVVVPLSCGWSDVGSWTALWEVSNRDGDGNALHGDVLTYSTKNTYIRSDTKLVTAIGVDDLIIVESDDAILVADKNHVQDVKKIVSRLKEKGRSEANLHRKVYRPWGYYDSIDSGTRFQVKRIVVKPGAKLSLQMHHHRAEHWIVVSGTAKVTKGSEEFLVTENQSTYIPLGVQHRLENPGSIDLEMIEVQSGSYLGEDDIVRFEDTYGRG